MKNLSKLSKVLGLTALLTGGAWAAQAQSVKITHGGNPVTTPYFCFDLTSQSKTFGVTGSNLVDGNVQGEIVSASWTFTGGIEPNGSTTGLTVAVKSKTGATQSESYSKYAKGKLEVRCSVKFVYTYWSSNFDYDSCKALPSTPHTHTYYKDYRDELEIRKQFSSAAANLITGPECMEAGKSVTYSVAPWVSLYQLNRVGFDGYYWNIPNGVLANLLYYSADSSSVTFVSGNDLIGKQISVTLGACNVDGQQPAAIALSKTPDKPVLTDENGNAISWEDGYCLPLGAGPSQLIIVNYDESLTYTWSKTQGWSDVSFDDGVLYFTPSTDARELRLSVLGPCSENSYDLSVIRSFTAAGGYNRIVPVSSDTCLTQGAEIYFTVQNAADGMPMQWSVTEGAGNGWAILAGANTARPLVKVGTGAGRLSVVAGCGSAINRLFRVTPAAPVITASASCISVGYAGNVSFSVPDDPNAVAYEWVFSDASWVNTSDDNAIQVPAGAAATTVKVRAIGYCSTSG